jgi:enoyl-CoA hydratase/carnithine racemase
MTSDVHFEEWPAGGGSRIGVATLDAPARLNALSHAVINALRTQLERWRDDERIAIVILQSSSEKAFCAGGNLRELYVAEKSAGNELGRRRVSDYVRSFFADEYCLDHALHTYSKPVLCWAHGLVMGGGLGLLAGCSHRVVTEGARLSMPEIAIGHFPDVGASWFMNRMPARTGLFAALTGVPLGPEDAVFAKLADYRIAQANKETLFDRLRAETWRASRDDDDVALGRLLRSMQYPWPAAPGSLQRHCTLVSDLCSFETLPEVYAAIVALRDDDDRWLRDGAVRLAAGYPGSAWLIDTLLRRAAHVSLAEVFRVEYVVAERSVMHGQFLEGIRALIIDKDRRPRWDRSIGGGSREWVERTFFEPVPLPPQLAALETQAAHPGAKTRG